MRTPSVVEHFLGSESAKRSPGGRPRSLADWEALIEEGLPVQAAESLKGSIAVPDRQLAGLLGISEKTLSRARAANGNSICSYPPEDLVIEGYGRFLKNKAKWVLSEERSRVHPFTTSVMDGIDIRETIRNWHEGKIYVRESDRVMGVPKLFFGYATGTNLMFPFRVGASVVLFPGRATADELFDQIERFRPTFLTTAPTMINNMLRSPRLETANVRSLRVCLSAGEALPPKLYEEWKERTGVEILDGIGSAEMFHIYISNRMGEVVPGSLGRIVPGYEAQIVDPAGQPVAEGEPGRLRIRGGSTALCYWADKAKSRETFQGEWCTTADIFRRDARGYYFYEGRDDDLLKVSGIWVSPLEIENVLLAHPKVAEVCVVGKPDEEQLVKPFAFVVLRGGQAGDEGLATELKAYVKTKLAPYKYPRWFEWRASLPKNDRGKVARKDLKAELDARRS